MPLTPTNFKKSRTRYAKCSGLGLFLGIALLIQCGGACAQGTLTRGDQQSSHVTKSEVEDHLKTPTQNKTPTRKDVNLDLARCSDEIYAYLRVLDVSRDTPGLDYLFIDALDDLEQQVEACLIDRADETKISQAIMVSNPSMPATCTEP